MTGNRVLVTGATGFLGGHLVRSLARQGLEVLGTGRDLRRGAELEREGVRFAPIDLADQAGLEALCRDVDVVVHCAALSTAWASRAAYQRSNVEGTANLVKAAQGGGVRRLVHVSTPAVLSRPSDQFELAEDEPLPREFTSEYGASKATAERIVATTETLETVIVRPKAIYGPGDIALLPRLIDAAAKGRLRVIGDGSTITHLTHVDDVVSALELLIEAGQVSGVYHVAGPEPVKLWEFISDLLPRLGYEPPRKSISTERALRIAAGMELVWRVLRLRVEPPLTRYKVMTVAYSQTLSISRIRTELRFEPKVTPAQGLADVVEQWEHSRSRPESTAQPQKPAGRVGVRVVNLATVRPPGFAVGRGLFRRVSLPVLVGVIEHLEHGTVLFDTGYGQGIEDHSLFAALYRFLLRPEVAHRGRPIQAVVTVIVSHLDPDHFGGVGRFPGARVVVDATAWESWGKRLQAPWRAITRRGIPHDLASRLWLVETSKGPVDLFGDRALLLVPLPGHAPGQMGLAVTDTTGQRYLFCGDAVTSIDELTAPKPTLMRVLAHDRRALTTTREMLAGLAADGVVIVPTHCPKTAVELAK